MAAFVKEFNAIIINLLHFNGCNNVWCNPADAFERTPSLNTPNIRMGDYIGATFMS